MRTHRVLRRRRSDITKASSAYMPRTTCATLPTAPVRQCSDSKAAKEIPALARQAAHRNDPRGLLPVQSQHHGTSETASNGSARTPTLVEPTRAWRHPIRRPHHGPHHRQHVEGQLQLCDLGQHHGRAGGSAMQALTAPLALKPSIEYFRTPAHVSTWQESIELELCEILEQVIHLQLIMSSGWRRRR